MKKFLLNAYINLNFGDDLFLKILFDRYPDVHWVLPKGGEKYSDIFRKYKNVEIKKDILFKIRIKLGIKEKNSVLNSYDGGLFIGGSIFMEIPEWKDHLEERKLVINSFFLKNKPYFILGSNFGPYKDRKFLYEYTELFKKCSDICFRDNYSKNIFADYSNIRLAPDIVFQLKPKNVKKIKNSVGISLINLKDRDVDNLEKYNDIYNKKIKELVEYFIQSGKKITFFSFCEKQGDLIAINNILKTIDKKLIHNINIINYCGDIDKFLSEFESMENIVGTRFHACILSQVFNQGLYPILYSNKTYNVLRDIGLDQEYTFIKDLDSLDVKRVLEKISNNKISNRNIFKEAEKQFEVLDKYVRS